MIIIIIIILFPISSELQLCTQEAGLITYNSMSTQYFTSHHPMGNGPPASNVKYKAQNKSGGIHISAIVFAGNNQHCSSF